MNPASTRRSLFVVALLFAAAAIVFAQEKTMSVTVREAPVRATPGFPGKVVTDLPYGTRVEVVRVQSG